MQTGAGTAPPYSVESYIELKHAIPIPAFIWVVDCFLTAKGARISVVGLLISNMLVKNNLFLEKQRKQRLMLSVCIWLFAGSCANIDPRCLLNNRPICTSEQSQTSYRKSL